MIGPVERNSDLTFYFDGKKEWIENVLLDTAPEGTPCASAPTPRTITPAQRLSLDEVYIYASALDASAVAVLYDDVTAAYADADGRADRRLLRGLAGGLLSVRRRPEGRRRRAPRLAPRRVAGRGRPAGRQGPRRRATRRRRRLPRAAGGCYRRTSAATTTGTICVLARVDSWAGGSLFEHGGACARREGWYRCLADGSIRAGVGCTSCDDCVATYNYTAYRAWSRLDPCAATSPRKRSSLRGAWALVLDQGKLSHGACHYITCGASSYSYSYSDSSAAARRRLDGSASGYFMDDTMIRTAVTAWFDDAAVAEAMYGHISTWETSGVTDMSELFCGSSIDHSGSWPRPSTKTSARGTPPASRR